MKMCHHCQKEIHADQFIGRQEQCCFCKADLHCCLNCAFYERGVYNDCREGQAERVLDKSRFNFCDYFRFKVTEEKVNTLPANSKDKLQALFKK